MNLFSKGGVTVQGIVIPHDTADERIENIWRDMPLANQNRFVYPPSTNFFDILTATPVLGTNRSQLSFVPVTITLPNAFNGTARYTDWEGKPIRFSIEIEAIKRTQLNEITYWWRPIHGYLT
jgi:uncharacterized protein involved in exopolysaccharide biosynthesis